MKISHLYFSANQETEKIAHIFHSRLKGDSIDLTDYFVRRDFSMAKHDLVILSVPVYANAYPKPLKTLLPKINATYIFINISYGGYSLGSTLYELSQSIKSTVIGYSVQPTRHTYCQEESAIEASFYECIIERIIKHDFHPITVPFQKRNWLEHKTEPYRTKHNIKIRAIPSRCTHCGTCQRICPVQAIDQTLKIDTKCLRCLRCVHRCEEKALIAKKALGLRLYLKYKKRTKEGMIHLGNQP